MSVWARREQERAERRAARKAKEEEEAARTDVAEVTLAAPAAGGDEEEVTVSVRWAHEGETGRELVRASMGSRSGHLGHIVSKVTGMLPDIAPATFEVRRKWPSLWLQLRVTQVFALLHCCSRPGQVPTLVYCAR